MLLSESEEACSRHVNDTRVYSQVSMNMDADGSSERATTPRRGEAKSRWACVIHKKFAGGDALTGHTRSHPEHDG